jgi:hypothetical protein
MHITLLDLDIEMQVVDTRCVSLSLLSRASKDTK